MTTTTLLTSKLRVLGAVSPPRLLLRTYKPLSMAIACAVAVIDATPCHVSATQAMNSGADAAAGMVAAAPTAAAVAAASTNARGRYHSC